MVFFKADLKTLLIWVFILNKTELQTTFFSNYVFRKNIYAVPFIFSLELLI